MEIVKKALGNSEARGNRMMRNGLIAVLILAVIAAAGVIFDGCGGDESFDCSWSDQQQRRAALDRQGAGDFP
jgi:hypothetical protein